jgi:hypothetical protein
MAAQKQHAVHAALFRPNDACLARNLLLLRTSLFAAQLYYVIDRFSRKKCV